MIPQTCRHRGQQFECGLSISCVLGGGKPMDLCSGGMIWSCCVDKVSSSENEVGSHTIQNASKYKLLFTFDNCLSLQQQQLLDRSFNRVCVRLFLLYNNASTWIQVQQIHTEFLPRVVLNRLKNFYFQPVFFSSSSVFATTAPTSYCRIYLLFSTLLLLYFRSYVYARECAALVACLLASKEITRLCDEWSKGKDVWH